MSTSTPTTSRKYRNWPLEKLRHEAGNPKLSDDDKVEILAVIKAKDDEAFFESAKQKFQDDEAAKVAEAARKAHIRKASVAGIDSAEQIAAALEPVPAAISTIAAAFKAAILAADSALQHGATVKGRSLDLSTPQWAIRHYLLNDMVREGLPIPFAGDREWSTLPEAIARAVADYKSEIIQALRDRGIKP